MVYLVFPRYVRIVCILASVYFAFEVIPKAMVYLSVLQRMFVGG